MSPASSSSSSASTPSPSSQLTLALGDGLGGECKGQLEQVNLAPEGIYLGGRRGGRAGKGGRKRGTGERAVVTADGRVEMLDGGSGGCDLEETGRGGGKVRLHLRLCHFTCDCHIIRIIVAKQWFPTDGVSVTAQI